MTDQNITTNKTFVFIDSQNLFKTFEKLNIVLDMEKLFLYLTLNLKAKKVFLFLGYISMNRKFYEQMRSFGYDLIFRPVVKNKDGYKANVDCDVVLHSILEIENYDQAIFITNDGDYFNTIQHLININKFKNVISPERKTCSKLLRRVCQNKIIFADDILGHITQNTLENPEYSEELPTSRG